MLPVVGTTEEDGEERDRSNLVRTSLWPISVSWACLWPASRFPQCWPAVRDWNGSRHKDARIWRTQPTETECSSFPVISEVAKETFHVFQKKPFFLNYFHAFHWCPMRLGTIKNTPLLVFFLVLGHLRSLFNERISSHKSWGAVKHIQGVGIYSQAQRSLSHWARQEGDGTRCSYETPPKPQKKVIWSRVRTPELTASLVLKCIWRFWSKCMLPHSAYQHGHLEKFWTVWTENNFRLTFILTPLLTPGGTPVNKWCDFDLRFWRSTSLVCMAQPK